LRPRILADLKQFADSGAVPLQHSIFKPRILADLTEFADVVLCRSSAPFKTDLKMQSKHCWWLTDIVCIVRMVANTVCFLIHFVFLPLCPDGSSLERKESDIKSPVPTSSSWLWGSLSFWPT